MFANNELRTHLATSSTVKSNALVVAEWNLNDVDNVAKIGNYRYRPLDGIASKYGSLPSSYDPLDEGSFYTDATNSDVVLDGGIDATSTPTLLRQTKEKERLLYSLEECIGRFRPRSGINKVRYGVTPYLHHSHPDMAQRPRYYMADKQDKFKYWTSYRIENGVEHGIANIKNNGENIINDAAPFVVYSSKIPTNRIIIKMQTNVGSIDLSPFSSLSGQTSDPFFGYSNQTTPSEWQVEVLVNNKWEVIKKFAPNNRRPDGSNIIGADGYVELQYGLIVPDEFKDIFVYSGVISSETALPLQSENGDAYLIQTTGSDKGVFAIRNNLNWDTFVPKYGWYLADQTVTKESNFVTNLANPESYNNNIAGVQYREFQYISGIRVSATKMNKYNSTLDIIEISPRLVVDISDMTESFRITKAGSDLGTTGLPVGQLLASTGELSLFDPDQIFLESNPSSIIPLESFKNMQLRFYDVITTDDTSYYVPLKTMYVESFPEFNSNTREVSISMRDLYFYFESISTPAFLMTNVSLSYAVSSLLDNIGFSNYTFKRLENETEDIIPFFYTNPDKSVAETLQDLAVSTQSAMFFDEYNNFVVMSKNYMIPSASQRSSDIVLYGGKDFEKNGVYKNKATSNALANIVDISMQPDSVYNDGKINYSVKYIQKSESRATQAYSIDSKKSWVYKPVTLWRASGADKAKAVNEQKATSNGLNLTAIPLKSNLSELVPSVSNGQIINNIIDFGESIALLDKYSGYFYAGGEIIRFDAVEYSITGVSSPVWISSVDEYQNYFAKLPFSGKIYPTGRIRIFAEPNYKIVNNQTVLANGPVIKHGRGQFGTQISAHTAGLDTRWTNGSALRGLGMNSKFIFDVSVNDELLAVTSLSEEDAGRRQEIIQKKAAIKVLQEEINSLNKKLLLSPGDVETVSAINSFEVLIAEAEDDISVAMNALATSLQSSVKFMNSDEADSQAKKSVVNGKIKNFLAASYYTENANVSPLTLESQMTQASALIMDGAGSANPVYSPINHITYVYTSSPATSGEVNTTQSFYTHFGTRMRVVGKILPNATSLQEANGSMSYLSVETDNPESNPVISGGSGGISGLLNPETGDGYYFEIAALDADNVEKYGAANVFFYKVISSNPTTASAYKKYSMPELLWRGVSDITVDGGDFVGQSRIFAQERQTVYDLAFEYVDNVDGTRTFYLYLNGTQIATLTDSNPISAGNSMALFVRGTAKCMFENIYALAHNYASNPSLKLSPVVNSAFGTDVVNINESFSKYAISGLVQSTYLANIGSGQPPQYNIYYDEFGTIMREAAYFDVKYTEAYPALYSRITPTISKLKSYVVSSYFGGSYNADFLVFNATDTLLDINTGKAASLEIQGITFTQDSQNELSVDEFFNEKSKMSDPEIANGIVVTSPSLFKQQYQEIKNNRIMYGRNEFTIDATYIQSRDAANTMMSWLSSKIMKPRKSVGVSIFPNPTIQLGDIVEFNYFADGVSQIGYGSNRFVVYQIEYSRSLDGPEMQVFLSEVS